MTTTTDPDQIPRRCDLFRSAPAELAIRAAVDAVESMGADVRLTDAVQLLGAARERVADYVDGVGLTASPADEFLPPSPSEMLAYLESEVACACHCSCCAPVEAEGERCPMCSEACGPEAVEPAVTPQEEAQLASSPASVTSLRAEADRAWARVIRERDRADALRQERDELIERVRELEDSLEFSKTQVTDLAAWKNRLEQENAAEEARLQKQIVVLGEVNRELADALEAYVLRAEDALASPSMKGVQPSPELVAGRAALRKASRSEEE